MLPSTLRDLVELRLLSAVYLQVFSQQLKQGPAILPVVGSN